jgi:ribosomal protein L11 methyltransferase
MVWFQFILESNSEGAELATELFEQFGAISVSLTAANEQLIIEQNPSQPEEFWERTQLTALLHEDTDLDVLLSSLRNRLGVELIKNHEVKLLPDKDWTREYEKSHGPKIYGDKLCICPGWHTPPANIEYVLNLEPGLAFGTGSHETTGLCLDWLVTNDIRDKRVIDYGCGSGILALSAIILGSKHVWAIDIDPQAINSTTTNAQRNHLEKKLTVNFPEKSKLPVVEILVANILLNPLKELAPRFADLLVSDGIIVLSGILAVQAEECLAAYQSWFTMNTPVYKREWALLTGNRKH